MGIGLGNPRFNLLHLILGALSRIFAMKFHLKG